MGKRLILKGANFALNAIGSAPSGPSTPDTPSITNYLSTLTDNNVIYGGRVADIREYIFIPIVSPSKDAEWSITIKNTNSNLRFATQIYTLAQENWADIISGNTQDTLVTTPFMYNGTAQNNVFDSGWKVGNTTYELAAMDVYPNTAVKPNGTTNAGFPTIIALVVVGPADNNTEWISAESIKAAITVTGTSITKPLSK